MTTDKPASSGSPPPADCCTVEVDPRIARHFDKAMRDRAATGALTEMVPVSRRVLELLADVSELHPTVLELGAGSGALSVALLERGAAAADGIDLSPESVATAQRRAATAGVAERAKFQLGDGAQVALAAHDWVILDRVICCYAHVDRLLANAIGACGRRFIFSVPPSSGWRGLIARAIVTLENVFNRFRGRPCPGYVHDVRKIEARLSAAGFSRSRHARVSLWYAAVWERPAA
jgi:magnesium-protoporphyrin O-methyltransferase